MHDWRCMDDKAGMGKLEGDFYLPGHPPTGIDVRKTDTNRMAPRWLGDPRRRDKGRKENGSRLTGGAENIPHPVAEQEGLRHKKNPDRRRGLKTYTIYYQKIMKCQPPKSNIFEKSHCG
jgi:hypothetical protein